MDCDRLFFGVSEVVEDDSAGFEAEVVDLTVPTKASQP